MLAWVADLWRRFRAPSLAMRVMEDPDELGYTFGKDPLLEIMPAEEWKAIEQNVELTE